MHMLVSSRNRCGIAATFRRMHLCDLAGTTLLRGKKMEPTETVGQAQFRRIVTVFTALAMLFIGKVITEQEFVSYLKKEICNVQKEQCT